MIIVINHSKLIEKYLPTYQHGNTGKKSLIGIGERLSGKCIICGEPIKEGGELVVCPFCLTVYHLACIEGIMSYNQIQDSPSFKCIRCGRDIPLAEIKKLKSKEVETVGRE